MIGKIIKNISDNYSVLVDDEVIICKPCGKFRHLNIKPLVGDIVNINLEQKYITEIKPRKNYLLRPPVSNIDQVIIVTSVKEPDFSSILLDKMLTIIEFNNIEPIICFTKLDLLKNRLEINKIIEYYKKIGYQVYLNTEIDKLKPIFKNKISVFTGQSGAGKSTLLNKLDSSLNIKTAPISKALNRGKHTTRHTELLSVLDGLIADTPGFSSLSFNDMTNEDIRDCFREFNKYKDKCQYKNCMHINEPNCAVKKVLGKEILLSRYENYLKFMKRGN